MTWSNFSKQKQFGLVICLTLLALGVFYKWSPASPIAHTWVRTTVRIENEEGTTTGTGFLVFRELGEKIGKTFLVTNKHVVNEDPQKRQAAQRLRLFVNLEGDGGAISGGNFDIPLVLQGKRLWREHENPNVDVLAVDISHFLNLTPKLHKVWARYSDFITPELMKKEDVTIGDEVLTIGYPSGLAHAKTNYPLVRQGMIATMIGERITIQIEESSGKTKTVEIPGFLVDAAIIPGSSGSPVILKPVRGLTETNGVHEISILPGKTPYLLGIVSAAKLTAIRIRDKKTATDRFYPAFAGLGVVYDANTVKDTIELFFK